MSISLQRSQAALSLFGTRRLIKKWTFPSSQTDAQAIELGCTPHLPSVSALMLQSSFEDGKMAQQWAGSFSVIQKWMEGPLSLKTWSSAEVNARQLMLDALKHSKSPVIQRVLDASAGICQDITTKGYYGYVLVSPLWGKCYVGGCGYTRARCPLERLIEHIRMTKIWFSRTSLSRYAHCRPPHYAAMSAVSPANVTMLIVARPAEAALAQAERYFTRKLHPVFNFAKRG